MTDAVATRAASERIVPLSLRAAVFDGFLFKAGTAIFVAAMTFGAYLALPLTWCDLAYYAPSAQTRAVVLAVEPTRWATSPASSGAIGTVTHGVFRWRYRFVDADGRGREGVSYSGATLHKAGDSVDVEFVRGWPSLNRAVGTSSGPLSLVFNTILVVAFVGLMLIRSGVRSGLRRVRLLTRGEEAKARVLSSRLNPGNPPPRDGEAPDVIEVQFEFTAGGRMVRASQRIIDCTAQVDSALKAGTELPVFYDPEQPQAAVLVASLPASAGPASLLTLVLFVAAHAAYIAVGYAILRGESIL